MYKYIYGPVPSRRLGISLGIDLVPHKVCSLDCIYCECGATNCFTTQRKEYVPMDDVMKELDDYLSVNLMPDWLTFSGSGEPSLNSRMGDLIRMIKDKYPASKVAVLTNGTLLCDEEVRKELLDADLVLPSLDAATNDAFITIDRPLPGICGGMDLPFSVGRIVEAIASFVREFKSVSKDKEVWLEVFLVEGVNTNDENIAAFREAFRKIAPDRIQLNTLDRPGTESWVKPVPRVLLEEILRKIDLPNVEIVSKYRYREDLPRYRDDVESAILETIRRRPSTIEDIMEITGLPQKETYAYLDILQKDKKILAEVRDRGIFWRLKEQ